jgi:hypothetical protein
MYPIFKAVVGSLVRHLLTALGTVLVTKGLWTEDEATNFTAAGAVFLVGLGWALYQKYATHSKLLDALDLPGGSTLRDLADYRR